MSDCSVGTARRHSRLIRSPWHIIVALVTAVVPVFAGPEVATRWDQGSAEQRWKDVSYVAGTGSLRPARHGDACDLVLQDDRLVIRPSSTEWRRCSLAGTEIRGDAITWLGYARGSGSRSSGLGGPLEVFFVPLGPSHLIAIGFRDSTGAEGSATFSYYSRLRGADVNPLLQFLSGIGRVPILTSAEDAAKLPEELPKTITSDPLRVLDPNVPLWQSRRIAVPGGTSHLLMADGSAALTDEGLWSVPEGLLRCPLPSDLRKSLRRSSVRFAAISPDGRTLVALHNSGAANGKGALRAGNLTLVDIATGKARGRTGLLPYLSDVVRSADGVLAFAVHGTLDKQPGGEPTLTAIDLARAEIVWRAPLPGELSLHERGRVPRVAEVRTRAWADGVVAFGPDFVGVWRGATGEPLLGPASVLQDQSPDGRPTRIVDAFVVDEPTRLVVVYQSRIPADSTTPAGAASEGAVHNLGALPERWGTSIAAVEIPSGKTERTLRVPAGSSFVSGGAVLLAWSREGSALWNSATLTPMGPLVGQKTLAMSPRRVSFDASGRRVATAVGYGPLDRTHVVIWDVGTQRAIGQCLFNTDATGEVRLLPGGRAVLASDRAGVVLCEGPGSDR